MSNKKNKALVWAEVCAKSGGTSFILAKDLKERAGALIKEVDEINAINKATARREADLEIMRVTFWHDVRKQLEANGSKKAFELSGIDFDSDAIKDNILVINLFDEKQGPPMRPRK